MPGMIRLDPRIPLLWRSPTAVQLGVDPRLIVLDPVTPADERVLAALSAGATRASLDAIATRSGGSSDAVGRLLRRVRPALEPPPAHPDRPARLVLDGDGTATAGRLAAHLATAGIPFDLARDAEGQRDGVALIVADHVLAPARAARWLAVDATHLAVVFGDQAVTIGPLVVPGTTPCLRCVDEYRIDADPAWTTLAAELLGRRPAATGSDPACLFDAAAVVARMLARLQTGTPTGLEGASIRLDGGTGAVSRRAWIGHDRCTCRRLVPLTRSSGRPRTATPVAHRTGRALPTTAAAGDVPA